MPGLRHHNDQRLVPIAARCGVDRTSLPFLLFHQLSPGHPCPWVAGAGTRRTKGEHREHHGWPASQVLMSKQCTLAAGTTFRGSSQRGEVGKEGEWGKASKL